MPGGGQSPNASDAIAWWRHPVKWCREKRQNRFPKAYPGDTYVADLHKASKTGKSWVNLLVPIIILSVFADFFMIWRAFGQVIQSLGDNDIFFICAALVALYLSFGHFSGKKLAEWAAFRRGASLWASVLMGLVMLAVLVLIFIFRLSDQSLSIEAAASDSGLSGLTGGYSSGVAIAPTGEAVGGSGLLEGFGAQGGAESGFGSTASASPKGLLGALTSVFEGASEVAYLEAICLSTVMLLGAIAAFVHAYFTLDPFASEKARLAAACIAEDKLLYESAFAARAIDPERDARIGAMERELDTRTVDCAFRIHDIALQLNSIVDPADAHDFERIRNLLDRAAAQENGRVTYGKE